MCEERSKAAKACKFDESYSTAKESGASSRNVRTKVLTVTFAASRGQFINLMTTLR
jgi:hypothetical protein